MKLPDKVPLKATHMENTRKSQENPWISLIQQQEEPSSGCCLPARHHACPKTLSVDPVLAIQDGVRMLWFILWPRRDSELPGLQAAHRNTSQSQMPRLRSGLVAREVAAAS